jgi:hypothetical protein
MDDEKREKIHKELKEGESLGGILYKHKTSIEDIQDEFSSEFCLFSGEEGKASLKFIQKCHPDYEEYSILKARDNIQMKSP